MNVLFVRLIFCFREGIADLRESTFRAILEINDCVTIDKAITKQAYSFKRKTRDYLLCFKRKVFTQINSLDQG